MLEQGERAERSTADHEAFERVFGTPHGVDVQALCRAFGVAHQRIRSRPQLRAALADPAAGISVLEILTTRDALRPLHAQIRAAAHNAARATLT
jgi:2-succinyl-5-enolpyruvyl-6-hydroxy-3-cyclohexene-1-carboxylate synthase